MQLAPRYEGPVVVSMDDEPGAPLAPFISQRQRLEGLVAGFGEAEWEHPTRCDGWSVRDVIAHLVSVNQFWHLSVTSGLAGTPTRYLSGFDPAATPASIVESMHALTSAEVLDQFVATNATLIGSLTSLSDTDWVTLCETPAGHVPIQILTQHGLWDAWIHERDIALPQGRDVPLDDVELTSVLRFAAAISPVLGLGLGTTEAYVVTVEATDPDVRFVLEVDERVSLHAGPADPGAPCLRGAAVDLAEGLSLRAPLPADTPPEWRQALGSLEHAFTLPAAG